MTIELSTPAEFDLLIESLSAAMAAVLTERNRLQELGLYDCAEMLTQQHKAQNALRYKLEKIAEENA